MTIVILLEQLFKINEEIRAKSNHDEETAEICRNIVRCRRISNAEIYRNAICRRRHRVDKTRKRTI